jgi:hypothetical protein
MCAQLSADVLSAVGGAAIDHHHLIGHTFQRLQAAAYVTLFVEGDDDG